MPYGNGTSAMGKSSLLNYSASFALTTPEIYCAWGIKRRFTEMVYSGQLNRGNSDK